MLIHKFLQLQHIGLVQYISSQVIAYFKLCLNVFLQAALVEDSMPLYKFFRLRYTGLVQGILSQGLTYS